jgi:hypothetical protein
MRIRNMVSFVIGDIEVNDEEQGGGIVYAVVVK